jgi:hypothetical protein
MERNKKKRFWGIGLVLFLLAWGGGILFSGCDQIQALLEMDGEKEPTPEAPPEKVYPDPIATGGDISFVEIEEAIYEVHKFTYADGATEYLDLTAAAPDGLTAWILVVAGGGVVGGGSYPSGGGGAGGVGEHEAYPLTAGTYEVVVGAGGAGGIGNQNNSTDGNNGGNSTFGTDLFVAYGGGGGVGGAGSMANANTSIGTGGVAGLEKDITGETITYTAGGNIVHEQHHGTAGAPGTGSGGSGRWNGPGGAGGSGVVIVRFPR